MPTIQQLVRKGRQAKPTKAKTPALQGRAPAAWRVHPRVHQHPEEAELRPAQGRPCPPDQRRRDHRLHPRRGPQPPGALDRARPRRSCEGPPGRPLQDHPRHARHLRRQGPQAGPQPLRRQEGAADMPRKGPAPRRELMPDPIYRSVAGHPDRQQDPAAGQALHRRADRLRRPRRSSRRRPAPSRSPRSSGPSTTSSRSSRSRAAASVAPPTRCRSRSGPAGPTPSPSAGSSATPGSAGRRRWPSASPTSCSTPATASALR